MIQNPERMLRFDNHYAQTKENIVYIYFEGDFSYDQAKALLTFIGESFGESIYYAVCDISRQGSTSYQARQLLSKWTKDRKLRASAMIGGSMAAKALTILIGNAIRLLGKQTIAIQFVRNLEQAQQWIDERRRWEASQAAEFTGQ